HLVEVLREHRRCEEGDGTQRLLAGVLEIVAHRRRQDEHAAGFGLMRGPVFEIELAGSRDDVLRLLGRVSVPTDPLSRLDPVDDGRKGSRPRSAIDGAGAPPTYGRVSFAPPLWRAAACWIRRSRQLERSRWAWREMRGSYPVLLHR